MKDFRELKVWEKGHKLLLSVYKVQGVEGENGDAELARFFLIARGSASELEYHLLLSHDLGFLSTEEHTNLSVNTTEIKRMLTSLIQTIKNHQEN